MSSDTKQRVTLFIDPAIIKLARAQAVIEDITLTEVVEKSLNSYLPKEIVIKNVHK